MKKTEKFLKALRSTFETARDKHEANYKSAQLMADISGDSEFFAEILTKHLEKPGSLNTLHYPVVGIDIELNEHFGLVANCWIPLPDKSTDISTKAIHHHGDMLLTTVTAYGPGYEHWMFKTPVVVDKQKELYELELLEQTAHPRHHVAFVDAYIAHLPLYPPDLTVTYALWSSRFPTSWKDRAKRFPLIQNNSKRLRDLAVRLKLANQLELKVVEYFDFYPTPHGFCGIKERKEFERTTNEDYLLSLFHILQETGNESLAPIIRKKISSGEKVTDAARVNALVSDLESGKPITGRLSPQHYNVPQANFAKKEIIAAISAQGRVSAETL
jgi:hypothetical protein